MADANAINLGQLRAAVLEKRFPVSRSADATRWLATAYSDVWNAADWTFKRVYKDTLAVTAGDDTPTMPVDYRDTIDLFDEDGVKLRRYTQDEFLTMFAPDIAAGSTGTPCAFTVVDRRIILSPVPDADQTFMHSYSRRLAHLQSDQATVSPGFMDQDNDYPLWSDHHAVLIPRAQAIGLQGVSDPTADLAQAEFQRQLDRMIADYDTPLVGQWGAPSQWGVWGGC